MMARTSSASSEIDRQLYRKLPAAIGDSSACQGEIDRLGSVDCVVD